MSIRTILFATDLSQASRDAFPLVYSIARDQGARVIVVHVIPTGTLELRTLAQLGQGESAERFEADIRHALQSTLKNGGQPEGRVPIEYKVMRGNTVSTVLRMVQDTRADLLVIGSHGRSGLVRLLMGSVAEQLMRKAPCPVLIAKGR
jgi:nucleotide-binding universal stress UspA family protein